MSSILEIIDNAFVHNMGKWATEHYSKVVLLIEIDEKSKTVYIAIADLGAGFLSTLAPKYAELKNEFEAIQCALQSNTTSRPKHPGSTTSGGNGLIFLQKNVFNGFRGSLEIRSRDTLIKVNSLNNLSLLKKGLPYNYGASVFLSLKYG